MILPWYQVKKQVSFGTRNDLLCAIIPLRLVKSHSLICCFLVSQANTTTRSPLKIQILWDHNRRWRKSVGPMPCLSRIVWRVLVPAMMIIPGVMMGRGKGNGMTVLGKHTAKHGNEGTLSVAHWISIRERFGRLDAAWNYWHYVHNYIRLFCRQRLILFIDNDKIRFCNNFHCALATL